MKDKEPGNQVAIRIIVILVEHTKAGGQFFRRRTTVLASYDVLNSCWTELDVTFSHCQIFLFLLSRRGPKCPCSKVNTAAVDVLIRIRKAD